MRRYDNLWFIDIFKAEIKDSEKKYIFMIYSRFSD